MKSYVASLLVASCMLNTEQVSGMRIQQHQTEHGIFSKLIAEQNEQNSFQKELDDAKERKK